MLTRRRFLATAAGMPVLCNCQPAFAMVDGASLSSAAESQQSMKVILSFATEVAHLPRDYEHIKAVAEFLTEEGLVGNFHLTGDYARALKRRGRLDVVKALASHEIGYHCNHHGASPFMAGYLEAKNWRDGVSEWCANELPGLSVVEELFARPPTYYTTEFAKAPQAVYASWQVGLPTTGYLLVPTRGHGAVWYCNSFVPNSENLTGLEGVPTPDTDLEQRFRNKFDRFEEKLKSQKTNLLRVIQHSYKAYAVRPFKRTPPRTYQDGSLYYEDFPRYMDIHPEATLQEGFDIFKRAVRYYAERAEFVSFSAYRDRFRDNQGQWLGLRELDDVCELLSERLDAYVSDALSVSPAEAFGMLVRVLRTYHEDGALPEKVFMRNIIGPTSLIPERLEDGTERSSSVFKTLRSIDRALDGEQAIPSSIEIDGITVGPGQMLQGLLELYGATRTGQTLESLRLAGPNLPVIADEPFFVQEIFTREIYPEGFEGRNICKMCRLQSWSWKPAVRV